MLCITLTREYVFEFCILYTTLVTCEGIFEFCCIKQNKIVGLEIRSPQQSKIKIVKSFTTISNLFSAFPVQLCNILFDSIYVFINAELTLSANRKTCIHLYPYVSTCIHVHPHVIHMYPHVSTCNHCI